MNYPWSPPDKKDSFIIPSIQLQPESLLQALKFDPQASWNSRICYGQEEYNENGQ